MPDKHERFTLHEDFVVKRLVTFHYSELTKDYVYPGERHNFWEFLYLDKGEVTITTDRDVFQLQQGDLVFYAPNEFHSLEANRKVASNILILSFECEQDAMRFFEGKSFRLRSEEKRYLSTILREGSSAFDRSVPAPSLKRQMPKPFGCEQMIKLNLEALLISLVRTEHSVVYEYRQTLATKEHEDELVSSIVDYLKQEIASGLTLEELTRHFGIGRTWFKTVFKAATGMHVMAYYTTLRVEQAKLLIREKQYTFTMIADQLGFSSIHYFSRFFKKETGMTLSEYAKKLID